MTTINKSVRIDEDMLEVIELYKKALKKMFKVKANTNDILSGAIIKGFEDYLQFFRMAKNGGAKNVDGTLIEIPEEAIQCMEKYENILHSLQWEEMQEEKEDK